MTTLTGTNAPDVLNGSNGDDSLAGYVTLDLMSWEYDYSSPISDADTLYGHAGNDSLWGGRGGDLLYGGRGDDRLASPMSGDLAYGGSGADVFEFSVSASAAHTPNVLYGGSGIDTLYLWGAVAFLSIADPDQWHDLPDGSRFIGIERLNISVVQVACTLIGGAFDDLMQVYGEGDDALYGGGGNDTLTAQSTGNDSLFGGDGDDLLTIFVPSMDAQTRFLDGGAGFDRIQTEFSDAMTGLHLNFRAGEQQRLPDQTVLTGFESISVAGTNFADTMTGGGHGDWLYGADGDDILRGGADDDDINGGYGNNTLFGGSGSDTLSGWTGANQLFGGNCADKLIFYDVNITATGGSGSDVFEFTQAPATGVQATILDFSAQDVIILNRSAFTALTYLHLSRQDFVQGTAALDTTDRILYETAAGALRYDPDGTGSLAANLFAQLAPGTALTAADFLIL